MKNTIEEKEMFQHIFEASMGGIIVVASDGCILLANKALLNLFGYKADELIGKSIEVLIPHKLQTGYKEYIKEEVILPRKETNIYGVKSNGQKISMTVALTPTIVRGRTATMIFSIDATQHNNDLRTIKQTNIKLIESNRKFDALINNLKGIVFRCKNSPKFEVDFISEGCLPITGYHYSSFKTKRITLRDLIIPEDREQVWKKMQIAIKKQQQYDVEYRIIHKNGEIKYVWEKGEAIYNENDEVVFVDGFISDITPLKESVKDLHRSDAKIKALLEAIPDTMLVQDRDGRYLDWYANSPERSFMPPEKFIGLTMEDALPPSVYHIIKKSHDKVIETGTMQLAEYSFPMNDKILYHEARVVLMNDHSLLTIIRDVTKKKITDESLSIRNNALASAINSIVISDALNPEIPIIYCNSAFESMTGYAAEEIIGKNCQFLQNDDRDQEEVNIMRNAVINEEPCNVVLRNYKKDGTLFWNNVTITPVFNDEKVATHFIGVQSDVTAKVKAEHLKEQTKKTLELIAKDKSFKDIATVIVNTIENHVENASVSIVTFDCEKEKLNLVTASKSSSFLNGSFEEALANSNTAFADLILYFTEIRALEDISQINTSIYYKGLAKNNDIKAFWSFPIKSSSKQILGVIAIYSDCSRALLPSEEEIILDMVDMISIPIEKENTAILLNQNKVELEKYAQKLELLVQERTQEVMATVQKLVETNFTLEDQILKAQTAEKIAKTSKGIASEIAKNFPNGFIAVIDKDLRIIFAEGEGLEQLGLEKIFYEGRIIGEIAEAKNVPKILAKKNVLKTLNGERLSFEVKYKERYFTVSTLPLMDDFDNVTNSVHVYNDISLQKQVEFTIQTALNKERELNSLKSRFISMASHEFRTPLSAILTSAILINKQNEFEDNLKREKYVTQIEKNVNHLTAILNDFLSLSKLDEGELVAVSERLDVTDFAKSFLQETTIPLKKEQIIVFKYPEEELYAFLDKKLLTHILNNLLSNAAKYSPNNTEINFKIKQLKNSFTLEITDNGIGIPHDEQKHLFSRFFRASNALNKEGTGLGLHIVKLYTNLMGGSVHYKTEANEGATFWLEFPNNNLKIQAPKQKK